MVQCFVPDCNNYSNGTEYKFYRFQTDEKTLIRWLALIIINVYVLLSLSLHYHVVSIQGCWLYYQLFDLFNQPVIRPHKGSGGH